MSYLTSPHWIDVFGNCGARSDECVICTKHAVELNGESCPKCLEEKDPAMVFHITKDDQLIMFCQPELSALDLFTSEEEEAYLPGVHTLVKD